MKILLLRGSVLYESNVLLQADFVSALYQVLSSGLKITMIQFRIIGRSKSGKKDRSISDSKT